MPQTRLSFIQWLVKYELAKDENIAEAFIIKWFDYLMKKGLHKGICTNEHNEVCPICSLEIMLEEYDNYTKTFFKY